jgi:transposase-like protein
MKSVDSKMNMEQILRKNDAQKKIIIQEIMHKPANSPLSKGDIGPICPKCSVKATRTHGYYGIKQRYICDGCNITLNEGSHLITHRSRNPDKWPLFLDLLLEGYSVRKIAALLHISPKTSSIWRKKAISLLPALQDVLDKSAYKNQMNGFTS